MSQQGIKIAAEVFNVMQKAREELIRMGSESPATKFGQQDIMLGQMFQTANDAIKEQFCKLTMMKTEKVDR